MDACQNTVFAFSYRSWIAGGRIWEAFQSPSTARGHERPPWGRWIPTTSVDQYSGTLASWYGVSGTDIPVVFQNIGRFDSANLGFLG